MSDVSKDQLEYAWKVHGYTNDYIRFADQKAGIVLAVESGLVAAMYAAKLHQPCNPARLNFQTATVGDTLLGVTCLLAFGLLLAGIVFVLFAIAPRLWVSFKTSFRERLLSKLNSTPKGSIFWEQVLAHGNEDAYRDHLDGMDIRRQFNAVSHHIHTLAGIAYSKFGWVNLSIGLGAVGALFAIVALFCI